MLRALRRVASWVLLAALCTPALARGQAGRPLSLLDVPFISQSELLCGGAAAAMVLRYWGERGVDAETFAPLVDRRAGGIGTDALIGNLRTRGWQALTVSATADTLARELDQGRPLLVLIEDRPGTYHYIVVVGATARAIVFHDPARAPFRVMSRDEFDRRSGAAGRWAALVLPAASRERAVAPAATAVSRVESSCDGLIDRGVRQAQANDLTRAEQTLTSALACGGSAPLRELAGVRLLQKRWPEVTDLASAALAQDPKDDQSWRLLATSRFVQDDRIGALEAWNRVGEPRVDLFVVDGLEKTGPGVVERLVGVRAKTMLTPGVFTLASRRLRELPAASSANLEYVPVPNGLAELRASVRERPLFPIDRVSFGVIGIDAIFRRQVEVPLGPLTSGGDRLTLVWRFWPGRPRESAAFTAPAPWGGTWGVDAFTERQPFKNGILPVAHRTGAHVSAAIWPLHWVRATLRGGVQRWESLGSFGVAGSTVRVIAPDDRIDARLELTRWVGPGELTSFGTVEFGVTVRSTVEHRGRVYIGRAGASAATAATPADIWFAGDTGRARGIPLRAHPVIDGGRLDSEQIGRRLRNVSAEAQQWWSRSKLQIGAAAFVDTARAGERLFPGPKTDVDVGIGARFSAPGFSGVLRIDIAHGLRDGDDALSFVYEP